MPLIPDDPTQKQALAAIAFSLALLYFANSLWYSGALEEVEAQEARVENMQAQNRTAQALAIRAGQDTEERMALYERHIAQLEQLIPESAEVAALLDQISNVEREVGVTVDMMRPEAEEPGDFYTRQTFQMRVFGEFHDVGRFLTSIASLSRILTPINVSLEGFADPRAGPFDSPVVVNFRFQTYVVPDRQENSGSWGRDSVSMRLVCACLFTLSVGWLVPGGLAGQNPAQGPGDSLALAFEREVFVYPEYVRRNPFKTLLSAEGGGPRLENLLLLGILYSPFPGESIALFGEGTRTVNPASPAGPETVTVELTGGTYRVSEGATLGSLTVSSIGRQEVTIELTEFGITETRTLLLPRGTSGQGGPK